MKLFKFVLTCSLLLGTGYVINNKLNENQVVKAVGNEIEKDYDVLTFGTGLGHPNSNGYSTWTATSESSKSYKIVDGNNNGYNKDWAYIRFGQKSKASIGSISNIESDWPEISSIDLTIDKINASYVNSISLKISSSDKFEADATTSINIDALTAATHTFKIPVENRKQNLYYKLEFDCKQSNKSTGNGFLQISKVVFKQVDEETGGGSSSSSSSETVSEVISSSSSSETNPPAPEKYTVSFNSNGGSAVENQVVESGAFITEPYISPRIGYTLTGWYKDIECTQTFDFNVDTITQNTILYAGWEEFDSTEEVYSSVDQSASYAYSKVTSADQITEGRYLIVSNYTDSESNSTKYVAFGGEDGVNEVVDVTSSYNNSHIVGAYAAYEVYLNKINGNDYYTIKVARQENNTSNPYMGVPSYKNELYFYALSNENENNIINNISLDKDGNAVICRKVLDNNVLKDMYFEYNKASNQNRFRYFKDTSTQTSIQLYKATSDIGVKLSTSANAMTHNDTTDFYYAARFIGSFNEEIIGEVSDYGFYVNNFKDGVDDIRRISQNQNLVSRAYQTIDDTNPESGIDYTYEGAEGITNPEIYSKAGSFSFSMILNFIPMGAEIELLYELKFSAYVVVDGIEYKSNYSTVCLLDGSGYVE